MIVLAALGGPHHPIPEMPEPPHALCPVAPCQFTSGLVKFIGALLIPHQPACRGWQPLGVMVRTPQYARAYFQKWGRLKRLIIAMNWNIIGAECKFAAPALSVIRRVRYPIRRVGQH